MDVYIVKWFDDFEDGGQLYYKLYSSSKKALDSIESWVERSNKPGLVLNWNNKDNHLDGFNSTYRGSSTSCITYIVTLDDLDGQIDPLGIY